MKTVQGSCLCGGVVYEVPQEDIDTITTCYCALCRKNHGAERRLRARTLSKHFRWVKGEELLSRFQHGQRLEKHFCQVCGTPLINRYLNDSDALGLAIATLDEDPGKSTTRHDHVASKPAWLAVHDELPAFPTVPEIFGEIVSLEPDAVVIQPREGELERIPVDRAQTGPLVMGDLVRASLSFGENVFRVEKE